MKQKFILLLAIIFLHFLFINSNIDNAINNTKPELHIQEGHIYYIESAAFSPDGKFALSAGDNKLKLWNIANGKEIKTFTGHSKNVRSAAFSPDGKFVLSGSEDSTLKLWDIDSGKEIKTFRGHPYYVLSAVFSPDGKYALSGSEDCTLKLWDIASGKEIKTFTGHLSPVYSVAFSPDGKYVLSGSQDSTLKLWDLESGKEIRTFKGHTFGINSVAFSPDGKYALSGSQDSTLKLWDIASGKEIKTFAGILSRVFSVAFSPDGKYALSGSGDIFSVTWDKTTLKLWDINSGKEIRTFKGHTDGVHSAAFSPDGKYALSGSQDSTLKLWDIASGKEIRTYSGHSSYVNTAVYSPDGKFALIGSWDSTLKLWDIAGGKIIRIFKGHSGGVRGILSIAFTADGKYALSTDEKTVKLWDIANGKEIRTFKGDSGLFEPTNTEINPFTGEKFTPLLGDAGGAISVAVSPDGKYALTGRGWNDSTLKLWDMASGKEIRTFAGEPDSAYSIAFSPDGKYALSGSYTRLKLWDIASGKVIRIFTGHSDFVISAAFSPDGKYALSGSWDNTVKLWDIASGKEIRTLNSDGPVAFSHDGKYALTVSGIKIKLWDLANGNEIKTFTGHTSGINSVAFSPDGKYALSGSWDSTMRIWNISDGTWTAFISGKAGTPDENKWLIWTYDGYWDSSPDGGDLIAMVQGIEVWNIDQFAVKNNRPDIIVQRLGSDDKTIEHFYAQYIKRLNKLKITKDKLNDDYHVPAAVITETKQNDKFIDIKFILSDSKYKLNSYNIYVNDVALFGSYGKEISGNKQTIIEKVELINGDNKIEISCMNENGVESFRSLTMAAYSNPVKHDLYFIGFGISDYKNNIPSELETVDFEKILKSDKLKEAKKFIKNAYFKEGKKYKIRGSINKNDYEKLKNIFDRLDNYPVINDLNYAHKDVLDLAEILKNRKDNFSNIYTYTFVNEQATVDNIKKAKELLKNAKPDDTLVLFIAGHGIHDTDKEATYYFLTYETDLMNLSGTAANFELIENILQGIPPRNKLFLMDTCESGEIEYDMSEQRLILEKDNRGINARAIDNRGLKLVNEEKKVRTYLFNSDRFIYNDLARRSGAIVFSSCKGGEFSYEDQSTKNGFFTFNIKEVLNKEKKVSIDKLKSDVIKSVAEISGGLQNPTVDRDNIYQKFGL